MLYPFDGQVVFHDPIAFVAGEEGTPRSALDGRAFRPLIHSSINWFISVPRNTSNPSGAPHNPFVFGETEPSQPPATPKCVS